MPLSPDDVRYAGLRWNTPLSEARATTLLDALRLGTAGSVLDLGCGWGELLLRAVGAGSPGCTGIGVDTDEPLLARGREAARARGVGDAVRLECGEAAGWQGSAGAVLCIGAAHAFGGTREALSALPRRVRPGGRLLFGDGCWPQPPSAEAAELFGPDVLARDALTAAAREAGWRTVRSDLAGVSEWDAFEAGWRAGREDWARAHPGDPRAAESAAEMAARRAEYETVYRGRLGFAYLVLERD